MTYDIPEQGQLELKTIIIDLNGTLSVGGAIVHGAAGRIERLKNLGYNLVLFTGNTRGDADVLASQLGISWKLAKNGSDKRNLALSMDPDTCVSIGNGLIDVELMKVVKLRIATMQAEGVHIKTLLSSDVIVPTINDALDLLIDPQRLIATVRL